MMIVKLVDLLSYLQQMYDMMNAYSKINRSSEGVKQLCYFNVENDAKVWKTENTVQVDINKFF